MENEQLGLKLKKTTSGCKLESRSIMCSRKMTDSQRVKVAQAFNAETNSVEGSRAFLSRKMPSIKNLFRELSAARGIWKMNTVKFEDGIRLIRVDRIEWMNQQIALHQERIKEAASEVHAEWDEIRQDARKRLDELYVAADYEFDIRDAFGVTISYPAIEPDTRLKTIAPELYEQERKKIVAQFEQAAIVAEQSLKEEFAAMVQNLLEKLQGKTDEDGKKHIIKQAGIDSLVSFAERFKNLSIGNDAELAALVTSAKQLAGGMTVKALKKEDAKDDFKSKLTEVSEALQAYVAIAPNRKFDLE